MTINFSPELTGIGPVAREYADALHAAGHEVIVVTGIPHYPEWRRRKADDSSVPYRVERCEHRVPGHSSLWTRALYELSFAYSVARRLATLPIVDIVLTIVPPLGAASVASVWAASSRTPCAAVVQDIVSAAAQETAMAGRFFAVGLRVAEVGTLRRCSKVGVINEAMLNALAGLGVPRSKLSLVPNWPRDDEKPFPPHVSARRDMGFHDGEIIAVHAGNMGAKQGLEVVVEAARLARARNLPVRFILIGDGTRRAALEAGSSGNPSIELWPLQSEENFRRSLAAADILLLTQSPSVREFAFPSKLISYTRAGRPILASVAPDSAAGATLARTGAALLVPPGEPAALLEGVLAIARDSVLSRRLNDAARHYQMVELDPGRLRAEFVAFVEATAEAYRVAPGPTRRARR